MKQIAKALLILILSVWASAENNLLSASNSPRSSVIKRVEVLQHRPRHERPQFKNPIMNERDFQYLYKVIKNLPHKTSIKSPGLACIRSAMAFKSSGEKNLSIEDFRLLCSSIRIHTKPLAPTCGRFT